MRFEDCSSGFRSICMQEHGKAGNSGLDYRWSYGQLVVFVIQEPLSGNERERDMPKGKPTAEQLMSGAIGGFSIDTCVFESLSFRLDTGEFSVLHQQLPPWLRLYIPSIVKREVIGHQVRNVHKSGQAVLSSARDIHRYTGLDIGSIAKAIDELSLEKIASTFEGRLDKFIRQFKGKVLTESGDKLLKELFERYFSTRPPFENSKDKKHEFPDAAALLALEYLAKKQQKLFVLVSNDSGWAQFCDQSDALFCVETLRDLTALYQADQAFTETIEEQIAELLDDPTSPLSQELELALVKGVPNCSWLVNAYTGFCSDVEAEVVSAQFQSFEPTIQSFRLWFSKEANEIAVVELELTITNEFDVTAEFSTWDSIDRESVPIGTGSRSFSVGVKMSLYLTLTGDLSKGNPNEWDIEIELSQEDYTIDAGEMEPDYSDYEE